MSEMLTVYDKVDSFNASLKLSLDVVAAEKKKRYLRICWEKANTCIGFRGNAVSQSVYGENKMNCSPWDSTD